MKFIYQRLAIVLITSALIFAKESNAGCKNGLKLNGSISISPCDKLKDKCISSVQAVHDYAEAENDSTRFSISVHASPWRLYDPQMRILSIDTLAKMIQKKIKSKHKSVYLMASWTAIPPTERDSSIADKLSARLSGFPVVGQNGFVWYSKDGKIRTTTQEITLLPSNNYTKIREGEDVFVSLTTAWAIQMENDYLAKKNGEGMRYSGAAWDIVDLCPDYALNRFETAADYSDNIGTYNAAIMRLEKNTKEDTAIAISLLKKSSSNGDMPSKSLFLKLTKQ